MNKPKYAPPMSIAHARLVALGSKVGRLGVPSKMPGFALGLSAFDCKRGSKLAEDPRTPCAHCFARRDFYRTKFEVLLSHKRRMKALRHPEWTEAMTVLIRHETDPADPYFRWHDSGDLQGVWHLANIVEVCRRTPEVKHWLPTHEPYIVRNYLRRVRTGQAPAIPSNLCIRISADMIGQTPKEIEGLDDVPTATTHYGHGNDRVPQVSDDRKDSIECKSYQRASRPSAAGTCGSCRACWHPRIMNVSYPIHAPKNSKYQLPLIA